MDISNFFSGGKINKANVKTFLGPLISIIIVFLLGLLLIKSGVSKISAQVAFYNAAKNEEAALATKLSNLQGSSLGSLEAANQLVVALPEKNSVMITISQVKKLAAEKNTTIAKFEISGLGSVADMASIQLLTQINTPDLPSLVAYLQGVPELAPILAINSVKMVGQGGGTFSGLVEASVYWAAFPQTIPSVREPMAGLTPEEQGIVDAVSALRAPDFQIIDPTEQAERPEPFN